MRVAPTQLLRLRRITEPYPVHETQKAHVGAAYWAHRGAQTRRRRAFKLPRPRRSVNVEGSSSSDQPRMLDPICKPALFHRTGTAPGGDGGVRSWVLTPPRGVGCVGMPRVAACCSGTIVLVSKSRPTLVFPVEDPKVDLFMEKSSFPPLGGHNFLKAPLRGAGNAAHCARAKIRIRVGSKMWVRTCVLAQFQAKKSSGTAPKT